MPFSAPAGYPYGVNGVLPSADVNTLVVNQTKCANFVDGDTLSPSAPVIIDSGIVRWITAGDLEIDNGGDLIVKSGGDVVIQSGGDITVQSGAAIVTDTGSNINHTGALNVKSTGTVILENGSFLTGNATSTVTLNGTMNLENGSLNNVKSGATLTGKTGCTIALEASVNIVTNSRTYTKGCRPVALYDAAYWYPPQGLTTVANHYQNYVASPGTAARLGFDIDVPDGSTITEYHMYVDPPNTHVATPGNQPVVELWQFEITTGTGTMLETVTDAQPDKASYEARHIISKTGLSRAVDTSTYTYMLVVEPESGADLQNNGLYEIPYVKYTRAKIGEER